MMNSKSKVAILFSSYGPYHLARVGAAASYFAEDNIEVCGVELSRSQEEYPWETDVNTATFPIHSIIKEEKLEKTSLIVLIIKLYQMLQQINPDFIAISGYFRPTMIFTLLWCKWFRKKAILLSESTEIDSVRVVWKEFFKSRLLKWYDAALVGGSPQKRYLTGLGMPSSSIFFGYNVVGNESFHPQTIRKSARPIPHKYFLSINRFIQKKNLLLLLDAYADYRDRLGSDSWDLVLCGDGELKRQIQDKIQSLKLTQFVHLTGFIQQHEMLPYLAHAECFLHTSTHEQWGLVVNEAMAAALPVIVSERCGCCEDLVRDGCNGFSFDPFDQQQLITLMLKMTSGSVNVKAMGQTGFEHIQKFSPDYFAQGLKQSIQHA
ncbi:MAG: glycosyltransferase family 4 protein [Cyanobacteria bacterium J06634_5]